MPEISTIQFKPLSFKSDSPIAQQARDYFLEWAGEGGLDEAFNPALNAALGMHVIATGSGPNMFEYSVEILPKRKRRG